MSKEIKLPKDTSLGGSEYVRMIDELGRSAIVPVTVFANYAQTATYFAIYDGATSGAAYSKTFGSVSSVNLPLRLGISGPLTNTQYWNNAYGDIMNNFVSDPASTSFDFRLLVNQGTLVHFDYYFSLRLGDDSGNRINKSYTMKFKLTYPNGSTEERLVYVPNDYIAATPALVHSYKISASTFIEDVLLDSLVGGSMELISTDPLGVSEILSVTELKVQVRL